MTSGGIIGGRYALDEHVGSGAMGVVWRARDTLLDRVVAVKQLRLPDLAPSEVEQARARAMREARIAARLHHPDAITVFDVVVADGSPWLIMEYLPSRSLAEVLAERVATPAEAAAVGVHVAAALAAAHAVGVVHRDVKPSNVLIGTAGTVKLTDFGISRALDDGTVTDTGVIAGTPAFLAPEVARGDQPGAASDVFALGATLYAAVEGRPPVGDADNSLGLLYRASRGEFDPPRGAGELTAVLTRLLAVEPADRPTAAEAGALLAPLASAPPAIVLPERLPAPEPRNPTLLMVSGAEPRPAEPATQVVARPAARFPARRLVAFGVAAVLLVAVGVVALTVPWPSSDGTAGPTTSTSEQRFDTEHVRGFLIGHYDLLPAQPERAWLDLAPEGRPELDEYTAFWEGYADVRVDSIDVRDDGDGTFTAYVTLKFREHDGRSEGRYRHTLSTEDGGMRITDTAEA
ncbi:serine/threonine-protein kinase [Actinosynnema sp. NPDC020468]|uniref:serine/threonine-protein kinase n=1 Tax=Actinosynnema sp. NPDC020468 TaxID=3154488 RepID=UPI0033D959E6